MSNDTRSPGALELAYRKIAAGFADAANAMSLADDEVQPERADQVASMDDLTTPQRAVEAIAYAKRNRITFARAAELHAVSLRTMTRIHRAAKIATGKGALEELDKMISAGAKAMAVERHFDGVIEQPKRPKPLRDISGRFVSADAPTVVAASVPKPEGKTAGAGGRTRMALEALRHCDATGVSRRQAAEAYNLSVWCLHKVSRMRSLAREQGREEEFVRLCALDLSPWELGNRLQVPG